MIERPIYASNGDDLSDEMTKAYYDGAAAACQAMREDAVYYGPCNAKPGIFAHVRAVADFIEERLP